MRAERRTGAMMKIWECVICGFRYDEAEGLPQHGIAAGTRWEDVPDDWMCPDCATGKHDFDMQVVAA
jgi:rubredoxin